MVNDSNVVYLYMPIYIEGDDTHKTRAPLFIDNCKFIIILYKYITIFILLLFQYFFINSI